MTSNISSVLKTYATLAKLVLFLIVYVHIVGCGWWICTTYNSNNAFYKRESIPGKDFCVYVDYQNTVFNISGTNTPLPCDDRDTKWTPGPTFAEDAWTRYTSTDKPFGFDWFTAGARPWNVENKFWEDTPKGWIAPMNMMNWSD